MTNIEKLREQLNVLEAKEDELRKQRLDNLDEIDRIESLIKDEERKLVNSNIMPLVGKYVKCTQTDQFENSVTKYIRIDKIKQKEEYDNEFIIRGKLVEVWLNDSYDLLSYTYDNDFRGEINLDWDDTFRNHFAPEDLTEIGEDEFNLAKNMIKDLL